MSAYEITRWDGGSTNNKQFPVIYVKPDDTLISAARVNSFSFMCMINNTDSIYDGKSIPGVMIQSAEYPNPRPNFFKATGLYAIQLVSDWHGYPQNNGTVSFAGIKETPIPDDNKNEPDSIPTPPPPTPKPKPVPKPEEKDVPTDNSSKSLTSTQLILLIAFIVMAVILIIAVTTRRN
jgi:hypothetical protein